MSSGVCRLQRWCSQAVLVTLALVVVAVLPSCRCLKGDFNVVIEGTPDEMDSVYYILGSESDFDVGQEQLSDLLKESQAKKYREIAGFLPDRETGLWELDPGSYWSPAEEEYYGEIRLLSGYKILIEVNRSEFHEDSSPAIAVVAHLTNKSWQSCVIKESEFENKEEARIRVDGDLLTKKLLESKKSYKDQ